MSLRKQGANKGAVTSFLISTPESGVDSIAITYALLDPILTVMRPVAAFFTAAFAGVAENLTASKKETSEMKPDLSCPVDGCCDGVDCPPEVHRRHHSFSEKLMSGLRYAFTDFWNDLAGYFFLGVLLAGIITALIPDSFFSAHLGAGLPAMLIMLAAGVPLYVCATASTPIAAALILKGVSPGAALVFLLVGPATNMATLTVLLGTLGKQSTAVYLGAIALCAVLFGLAVDAIYSFFDISAQAVIGHAAETLPYWLALAGTITLALLSIQPLWRIMKKPFSRRFRQASPHPVELPSDPPAGPQKEAFPVSGCGPT